VDRFSQEEAARINLSQTATLTERRRVAEQFPDLDAKRSGEEKGHGYQQICVSWQD
jgi:hypothetical protein